MFDMKKGAKGPDRVKNHLFKGKLMITIVTALYCVILRLSNLLHMIHVTYLSCYTCYMMVYTLHMMMLKSTYNSTVMYY